MVGVIGEKGWDKEEQNERLGGTVGHREGEMERKIETEG